MKHPVTSAVNDSENFLAAIAQFERIGTFDCTLNFIDLDSEAARTLFSQVIVIKAEHDIVRKQIRYTAIAPFFDPVRTGYQIPHYTPHITHWPEGTVPQYTIRWKEPPC